MGKTTLVALAAGMGSRFGGLKQMTPVADNGAVLLNFSVYDAAKAGFDKVVFIIKEEMYKDFKEMVGDTIKGIEVDYAFQEMDSLPEGRKKPWGTSHAILCCRDKVDTPFAVINADDYYGRHAYSEIHDFLENANGTDFSMVAFQLKNTLSDNGTVTRGVCEVKDGYLTHVTECHNIDNTFRYSTDTEQNILLPEDSLVSMNLWGYTPAIFDELATQYEEFKSTTPNIMKDEFLLPTSVEQLIHEKKASVKVFQCPDKWYGMTYADDLPVVRAEMNRLIADGCYDGI